jgi:putative redox protein
MFIPGDCGGTPGGAVELYRLARCRDSASPFPADCILKDIMDNKIEISAEYRGGVKCEVTARGHRVMCDQPLDNGGSDEGMSPPEFLLASLATCAAYYAVEYLKARKLPPDNVKVRVVAEKAKQPARLASFGIEVMAPGLDEQHQAGVLRAVKACLIHNTLLTKPAIEVSINAGVLAHI